MPDDKTTARIIDQVAEAIYDASEIKMMHRPLFVDLLDCDQEDYRNMARAALAALATAGLPDGHLHPTHYDILARAGVRMDRFTRAEVPQLDPTERCQVTRQAASLLGLLLTEAAEKEAARG